MQHKNLKYFFGIVFISLLFSCTPLAKLYLGVRNPDFFITNPERLEYYNQFYEPSKVQVDIYTIADTASIKTAFDSLWVPRIFVRERKTDSVYVLDCYEDISANVEDINNKNLSGLNSASKKEFLFLTDFLAKKSKLTYSANKSNLEKEWDVFIVTGIFMGKKIRRRSLPVANINGLNQLIILDLSMDVN